MGQRIAEVVLDGVDSFRNQFFAATGHVAPRRMPADVGKQRAAGKTIASVPSANSLAAVRQQLEGYAFVEVVNMKDGGTSDPRACGWLVQSSGSQVLLLTVEGISMGVRHLHDNNAVLPAPFYLEIKQGLMTEPWAEGLSMFHNPKALHPVDPDMFPGVAHHFSRMARYEANCPNSIPTVLSPGTS